MEIERECKYCHEHDIKLEVAPSGDVICERCKQSFVARWNAIIDRTGTEYEHYKFDTFLASKENQRQVTVCKDFVSNKSGRDGLLLVSPQPGNGKTHLAVATLRQWVSENYEPPVKVSLFKIVSEPQLLLEVRATFKPDSNNDELDVIEKYASPSILLIDDVGKYSPQDLSFLQRVMFAIIDKRYIQHKRTIITSNKSGAELQDYLGAYTFDRICGMTNNKVTQIAGESYRRKTK